MPNLTSQVRDNRQKYGLEALSIADDPADIMAHFFEQKKAERECIKAADRAKTDAALVVMQEAIASGTDRKLAFQAAMICGATLQQIGDIVGLTRERVRQITDDVKRTFQYRPRPPRKIECRQCGTSFSTSGQGRKLYCDDPACMEDRAEKSATATVNYHRRLRATASGKEYRRRWSAKSRAKEKLLSMSREDLADVLSDLAAAVKSGDQQPLNTQGLITVRKIYNGKEWALIVGPDMGNPDWGFTFLYQGKPPNERDGITVAWRHVWRVNIRWPFTIHHHRPKSFLHRFEKSSSAQKTMRSNG